MELFLYAKVNYKNRTVFDIETGLVLFGFFV